MLRTLFVSAVIAMSALPASADPENDRRAVATLDIAYQAAVERNDARAMAEILHDDMILVVGRARW